MFHNLYLSKNLKLLLSSKLVIGTGIFTLGMFITSIINYVLQMLLGRVFLSVEDFGTFNSLLSLTYIIVVPGNSVMLSLIKHVSKLKSQKNFKEITEVFWGISFFSLIIGTFLALLLLVFRQPLATYLNLQNSAVIVPFAFYIAVTFLNISPRAFLQGLLRFKGYAFYTIAQSSLRLIFPIGLLYLGYSSGSVFIGLSLAILGGYSLSTLVLKKNFRPHERILPLSYYSKILKFSIPVIVIQVCMNALMSMDLIMVKHFFSGFEAGLYASVVTIGKVILFGTGIISSVMYPIITDAFNNGTNFLQKFFFFLGIQATAILGGIALFGLFPEFITSLMFGARYLPATHLLPRYVVFIGLFSMLNFLTFFSVAIERLGMVPFLIFGLITQLLLMNIYHYDLSVIININTLVVTILLLASTIYLIREQKNISL